MEDRLTLIDPGAMLSTTHELDGGSRVRLRLTRPSDAARVRSFLEGLPAEARELRFGRPSVADEDVHELTFFDPRQRLVVTATMPLAGTEEIVGLAEVTFVSMGVADLGVVVGSDARGRGVGSLLAQAVAALALQRGATHLRASGVRRGEPMASLLRRLGPTVHTLEDGSTVAYTRLVTYSRHAA